MRTMTPLLESDMDQLLGEEFHSLWRAHQDDVLSGKSMIELMEFETELKELFGGEYYGVLEILQENIPYLVSIIGDTPDGAKRKAFLVGLYRDINRTFEVSE